jgi:hypothetical protein
MKKNKLAFKLIDMGLKAETLANLTESQLRLLYNKLNEGKKETKEAVTPVSIPAKTGFKVDPTKPSDLPPTEKGYSVGKNPTDPNTMIAMPKEGEMAEGKKKSKKYNPFAICASSVGRKDKEKYERCVMGVKESIKEGKDPVNLFLEEKIVSLLEQHIQPKISKKDFLQMIFETETAPAKPKEKEKGKERKGPFDVPKVKPAPKAKKETNGAETETAEPIVKPKNPTTKPKTPFSPKPGVKPAPKAGKGSVPTWLKWDNFGLKF